MAHMYYWKTDRLAEKLKNNDLTQAEYRSYYIATSVLFSIGYYLTLLEPQVTLYAVIFEAIGGILVTIIGLNIIFRVNGGNSGNSYLNRVVSLSFPLFIKMVVASFVSAVLLESLREMGSVNSEQMDWLYSASVILLQIAFFWRIKVHVQYINA